MVGVGVGYEDVVDIDDGEAEIIEGPAGVGAAVNEKVRLSLYDQNVALVVLL